MSSANDMLDFPNVSLDEYSVSLQNGFLPTEPPLRRLPNPYYNPWEDIMTDLPALIRSGDIRQKIRNLPALSTEKLHEEPEWRRAYLILAFLTHSYIWGGERPEERLPPSISCPFLEVASYLELPPCATYAALNLWNFTTLSQNPDQDLTEPDNLAILNSFTGTDDERWFFVISVAIEACGAKVIPLVLNAIGAANLRDHERVTQLLVEITDCLAELSKILERMHEKCAPAVFYHQIRPFLAGSKNMAAAGLPRGVFYDQGDGSGEWRQYSGGSNAQSSLIQLFDIALGVEHWGSGEASSLKAPPPQRTFMMGMRNYMPGPHRRFLEYVAKIANIRSYAMSLPASSDVRQAYNAAVMMLGSFRDKHIQIVSRYIIAPARRQHEPTPASLPGLNRINLATATSQLSSHTSSFSVTSPGSDEPSSFDDAPQSPTKTLFYGTGGTALIPFLKQTRDETKAAARYAD
ncbi:hypothetical protein VTN77DRAFT_3379 [Rasamsonia byssochlamydoides]|uniref:uncharacterized protein n=1 Tax=Rasamsonia byssochlamydoides TaxID=89139 RepID=UPI0037428786